MLFLLRLFGASPAAISKAGARILSVFQKAIDDLKKLEELAEEKIQKHQQAATDHQQKADQLQQIKSDHAAVADKIKALVQPSN